MVDNLVVVKEFRDLPIEIPIINEVVKEIKVTDEKVVAIESQNTEIEEVPVTTEKVVI